MKGKVGMNGAAGEKQEAEKRIKEYIQASSMSLSKKEEQDFKELVIHNEETAKKVFRGSNHTGKAYILIFLNSQGKGADIAKEEAAAWAGQMEFINSNPLEERAFRSWLSGETDIMQMYSAIYAISGNAKAEKEFYRNFICTWLEQDKDRYLAAIEKISKDMRKKIFAVLKRENLYTA